MPLLPPVPHAGTLSALFVAAAAVGAGWALRALRRRERRRARRRVADVRRRCAPSSSSACHPMRSPGRPPPPSRATFWSALEELTTRGPGWLRLSRALADCPHLEHERRALREQSPWRRELAARRLGLLFSSALARRRCAPPCPRAPSR